MYNIHIPSNYYLSGELTPEELLTYSILGPICYGGDFEDNVISIHELTYRIHGISEPTKYMRDSYIAAIKGLIEKETITGRQLSKYTFLIRFKPQKSETFAMLTVEDIQKIMCYDMKNNAKLFLYYVFMMGAIGKKSAKLKMDYFEQAMGINKPTIIAYNKILEELKILSIDHSVSVTMIEGNIVGVPNTYYRYSEELNLRSGNNANNKKSLGHKLHWFKKGKEYSLEEIKEMYNYVLDHNNKEMQIYESCPVYIPNIWDTSIFNDYL